MVTKVVNKYKEEFDVYIGRPGKWGNPFTIGKDGNREEVIEKFKQMILKSRTLAVDARYELKDKRIGCFCKPLPCHGDIYAWLCDMSDSEFEELFQFGCR